MLPDGRRLGAHLPLGQGMAKAVDRAHEIGASALQIFGDNPTAWKRRAAPPSELPAFRERLATLDIGPLAIHASYLVNLAGPDPDYFERSVGLLAAELADAPAYGARFVNVHTGSHRDTGIAQGIERVADGIAWTLAETDRLAAEAAESAGAAEAGEVTEAAEAAGPGPAGRPAMLVLENSAGAGFGLGTTIDELAAIAEAVDRRGIAARRVGFCLDCAHLWGAGHRISDPDVSDALVESFDRRIGLGRLAMIHLNDSKVELGSHLDRHEHIGAGRIGEIGMAHLLRHPRLAGATYYLETPGMDEGYDAVNVARALALAAGRPLEPLPPEAMHLRGSRSRSAPVPEPA